MSDKAQYRRWGDHLSRVRPLATVGQPEHLYRPRDGWTVADRAAYADTVYHRYLQEKIAHNRTRQQAREDRHHAAVLLGVQEMRIRQLEQVLGEMLADHPYLNWFGGELQCDFCRGHGETMATFVHLPDCTVIKAHQVLEQKP